MIGKRSRTETDSWTERIKIDGKKNTRCQRTRVTLAMKTCKRRWEKFKNEKEKNKQKKAAVTVMDYKKADGVKEPRVMD